MWPPEKISPAQREGSFAWPEGLPALTQKLVMAHYYHRPEELAPYLAPEVVWLGAMEGQYAGRAAEMLAVLEREKDIEFELYDQEYQTVYAGGECAAVLALYGARTAESSGYVLAFRQRATFLYRNAPCGPLAVHIHVSNDWQAKEPGEPLAFRAGRETYQYVQELLRRKKQAPQKIMLRDVHQCCHLLLVHEIMFAETQGSHCVLHCVNGKLELYMRLKDLAARLPETFVRAHRSYLVNLDYVIGLSRFELYLCDGYSVPVPEQGYTALKRRLKKHVIGEEKHAIGEECLE